MFGAGDLETLGFRVYGLGFRVYGLGFRVFPNMGALFSGSCHKDHPFMIPYVGFRDCKA